MATAEPASATLGPRYAPEDPTLPKPWTGLIDGSTGLLYYWNPETNVTQYEKPPSVPPQMPPALPPNPSTPKLAQIPMAHSSQPNGLVAQAAQQTMQASQQQGQQISRLHQQYGQVTSQQQGPQVVQVSNQQGAPQQVSQLTQAIQQPGQMRSMQLPGQHLLSHAGQQMPQQGVQQMPQQGVQQMPQQGGQQMAQQGGQQMPQQVGQYIMQHQILQMPQTQGHQYAYQQPMQYMTHQQNMPPQGQQSSQHPTHLSAQGLQFPNQHEYKAALPKREEVEFQQGNQTGFSPTQSQQTGGSSSQNLSAGSNSVCMPHPGVQLGQAQQFGNSSVNIQQPPSMVQMQQIGTDFHQQHGPRFQNHMGPSAMHNQQSNLPPAGLNMGYDNNARGRSGNDHYINAKMEGPVMSPHQPEFTAMSRARKQQELRTGGVPFQNVGPGHGAGFNADGHPNHNMYSQATSGPPFSNNALMRPPFIETADISSLSPVEVYRQEHEVTATGDNVPAPFMTFEATGFPLEILRDIHTAGFLSPTPIQAQTWPIALQSRDIVAIAKTGSGKTLGYLIPAFILIQQRQNNAQNGPTVLVLAPTRELATQIQDEVMKFGRSSRVSCTCLYGGAPKIPQLKELERGADIVVATPGRLNDILEMKRINFRQVSLLVLDEADRMLDMGFEPQIRKIVNEIPPQRQTLMYTATWPKEVRKIASDLLVHPVQVNIGSVDVLAANKSITQYVEVVPQMEKDRRLEQILRTQERGSKAIIFCSTKRLCDQLARSIGRNFGAAAIHGDKSQGERDWAFKPIPEWKISNFSCH
ncbi:DEAD-BOX ATP-DEPENDENT RNA HELICASE 40 [Salix koriyanagi]|uniref:RNA helicase n=1 Tax=Salix koriyanagi TaxID=2511006 RepID=A0A9Q0WV51_9ROSI|nr:DEAD-BOX ATP-DEPENDENT RNA HELICASE 40 [Salix koriyanagi]